MSVWGRLRRLEGEGRPARVAVVGAGYVGQGLVHRLERTPGLRAALVVNRSLRAGVEAYERVGHARRHIVVSDEPGELAEAIDGFRPAVTTAAGILPTMTEIDVVVEATGAVDHGATVMLSCLEAGKNVISVNAEVDATIGHLLHHVAKESGAVYTISDGDQPGGLLRQIELAEGMGFEVVAAVNCKRHLDVRQTPATSAPYAERDGTSLAVTTSAGDGTKMQIECAVVANVAGLPPTGVGCMACPPRWSMPSTTCSPPSPGVVWWSTP